MIRLFTHYARWLHTQWPAGQVEKLPHADERGRTSMPGVYVAGDLSGIPLLKFSLDSGARIVGDIDRDPSFRAQRATRDESHHRGVKGRHPVLDVIIVGGGVSGFAAAIEAQKRGLSFVLLESNEPFSTVVRMPARKPIYLYPSAFTPASALGASAQVKEGLIEELRGQTLGRGVLPRTGRATRIRRRGRWLEVDLAEGEPIVGRRVVIAIGRSGSYRKLGVPGEEDTSKVMHRLHDPADFRGRRVLVVGGGDTALESAVLLAEAGAEVALSYRGKIWSRPKPENVERLTHLAEPHATSAEAGAPATATGPLRLLLGTRVRAIRSHEVLLEADDGSPIALANDFVFVMIGREPPLELFRDSGIRVRGEWRWPKVLGLAGFLLFAAALYDWKSGGFLDSLSRQAGAFPYALAAWARGVGLEGGSLAAIAVRSATASSFWYTLAYSILIVVFGLRRIRRRRTPYVTVQTWTLMAIQVVPLFLLPEILLPWMDAHGWLPASLADALFPRVSYGHGREFWRAYGFVLAWPLNVYNVFTDRPLWAWLAISVAQTLVAIPVLVYVFGKGAYCGWICSCGALAETLGDTQRDKMPHGPGWNRLNLLGQVVLAIAVLLLVLRVVAWTQPAGSPLRAVLSPAGESYKWIVDVFLAGVLGYGLYFWFSGRTWCRFACPLAAWMHVLARGSRFRIFAEKKKCISCNVCTSVCHQGIDVMAFANKGHPLNDPQCVRCSACVEACPTGVLSFGRIDPASGTAAALDRLEASSARLGESRR